MDNETNVWQKCPKCSGSGKVFPTHIEALNSQILLTHPIVCNVCNGKCIISMITGKPPID